MSEEQSLEYQYLEAFRDYRAAARALDDAEREGKDTADLFEAFGKAERRYEDFEAKRMAEIKREREEAEAPAPKPLVERTSFARFMLIAGGSENWDGAERELQQELFGDSPVGGEFGFLPGVSLRNFVPIEALGISPQEKERQIKEMGGVQMRVDAVTNPDNQIAVQARPIAQQVFNNAITAFMGVDMLTVPAGEQRFSWITAGATAGFVNRGASRDTAELTLTTASARPIRLSTGLIWNIESVLAVGSNLEARIRENVRLALANGIEDAVLNGSKAADSGSNTPAFTGIIARITASNQAVDSTSNDDTATSWSEAAELGSTFISDNEFPFRSAKRWLLGDEAAKYYEQLLNSSLSSYLPASRALEQFHNFSIRVSDHIPNARAATSNSGKREYSILIGDGQYVKVPIWRNLLVVPSTEGNMAQGRLDVHAFMNQVYSQSANNSVYGMRRVDNVISAKT